MSQSHTDPGENNQDELERLLMQGIEAPPVSAQSGVDDRDNRASRLHYDQNTIVPPDSEDEEENMEVPTSGDIQGALGLFAEATQDMATAGVEFSLGRHFACVDFCNQAVEKADEVIPAEQASVYVQHARHVLKWAKLIILRS